MDQSKEPHTISLKVLRLSRPQLASQEPLPEDPTQALSHQASLALPTASIDDVFTLTPLLTLPQTFGTAYVGESFSCILSLNNELPLTPPSTGIGEKRILSVKIAAEMQTPSQTRGLLFSPSLDYLAKDGLAVGDTKQAILSFDLREEGVHVLVVNISYTESIFSRSVAPSTGEESGEPVVTGGRVRLLRKLYNFNVGPCLSVRTKATALQTQDSVSSDLTAREIFLLECQLENLASDTITMERLIFEPKTPFKSKSLNWDEGHIEVPVLAPREVTQVAFLIEEDDDKRERESGKKEITKDGRVILGVLTIHWRSAMGSLGVLSTGWLASRPRR